MKQNIHPKYEKTIIKCACGNEFETRTTVGKEVHVELCSNCHPFYTGKQKFVDTAGRVDKFRARMEKANKGNQPKETTDKELGKDGLKSNQEKLADIKKELTEKAKPITVTQEQSSDVEIAAASELAEAKKDELKEK